LLALGAVASAVVLFASPALAGTIYQDDFNRTGSLNGSTPSTTSGGAKWTSATSYTVSSGSVASTAPGSGNGTEAYLPVDLSVAGTYSLSATLTPSTAGSTDWLSLGFISTGATNSLFQNNPPNAMLWLLYKENGVTQSFYGGTTSNVLAGGTASPAATPVTFTINLNSSTGDFSISDNKGLISRTGTLSAAQISSIHDVAIGTYSTAHGSFSNFSFSTTAPEPGSIGLLAVAAGGLLVRRRRA
jgi:hypothetical protein